MIVPGFPRLWVVAIAALLAGAAPVAADGKIYFTSEDGAIFVVRPGPKCEVMAVNLMNEICMATPAISDGVLFIRSQGDLYAIGAAGKVKGGGE